MFLSESTFMLTFADSGQGRDPRGPGAAKSGAPAKVLPIEIPAIQLAELNGLTGNFGQKALVGEGSYGQVYRATLSTGEPVAIKKLDPNASSDPDSDFAAQVNLTFFLESSRLHLTSSLLDIH